ncbi:hypothetical protein ACVDG5_018135 [Mesorhizobium sp. ORM6]
MVEITWTQAELDTFDQITSDLGSLDQMDRIRARIDIKEFKAKHGADKCDVMFAVLKEADSKAKAR